MLMVEFCPSWWCTGAPLLAINNITMHAMPEMIPYAQTYTQTRNIIVCDKVVRNNKQLAR